MSDLPKDFQSMAVAGDRSMMGGSETGQDKAGVADSAVIVTTRKICPFAGSGLGIVDGTAVDGGRP